MLPGIHLREKNQTPSLQTTLVHLFLTKKCHTKNLISRNSKHLGYRATDVAVKHPADISIHDIITCFCAKDFFRKLSARKGKRKENRNYQNKGTFSTNCLKQTILYKRPFYPLKRPLPYWKSGDECSKTTKPEKCFWFKHAVSTSFTILSGIVTVGEPSSSSLCRAGHPLQNLIKSSEVRV